MIRAFYSLVRYNADPARGEELNIGVVLWKARDFEVRLEPDALARVVRDNPHLERDALFHLEYQIKERLQGAERYDSALLERNIHESSSFPLVFTEARQTLLDDDSTGAFEAEIGWLLQRIVQVRRHWHGGTSYKMIVGRGLRPFVKQRLIYEDYPVAESRSGAKHSIEFFLNSQNNLALETISLGVSKGDIIRERAFACAFKVDDILDRNHHIEKFYVLCQTSGSALLAEANESARLALTSAGAEVLTDPREAVRIFTTKALALA